MAVLIPTSGKPTYGEQKLHGKAKGVNFASQSPPQFVQSIYM